MTKKSTRLEQSIRDIIDIARLAPSVHNTQPWLVSVNGHMITIRLDRSQMLSDGDPTNRQTYISLGIFTQAVMITAEKFGFELKEYKLTDHGVDVIFHSGSKFKSNDEFEEWVNLLYKRHSDRSIYTPVAIDKIIISALKKQEHSKRIDIIVVTDKKLLRVIAEFTGRGIGLAMRNANFRSELSSHLVLPWSRKKRGISVRSLYINQVAALFQPLLIRTGWLTTSESKLETKRWNSASADIVIMADGDLPEYWLQAGMTYLYVSLTIEKFGLSQATSAALAEASDYHEDVEKMLHSTKRIMTVIRIGLGSSKNVYSPRLSADDIITSN